MNNWKEVILDNVTSRIGDGLHGTPQYDVNGKYHFINGNNLNNGG
jgi:type I restriction enzyme S subunit